MGHHKWKDYKGKWEEKNNGIRLKNRIAGNVYHGTQLLYYKREGPGCDERGVVIGCHIIRVYRPHPDNHDAVS